MDINSFSLPHTPPPPFFFFGLINNKNPTVLILLNMTGSSCWSNSASASSSKTLKYVSSKTAEYLATLKTLGETKGCSRSHKELKAFSCFSAAEFQSCAALLFSSLAAHSIKYLKKVLPEVRSIKAFVGASKIKAKKGRSSNLWKTSTK